MNQKTLARNRPKGQPKNMNGGTHNRTQILKLKKDLKAFLFLAPAIILAALFCWFPAVKSLFQSFLTVSQSGKILGFAGLNNFKILFKDPAFLNSVLNTIKFIVLFVPLNTFLTLLAASLTRRKSRLSFIPEYIFFVPVAVSLSAYSLLFKDIFRGTASIANKVLGLNFGWITTPGGAMATLVILGVFLDFGIDYILLMCAFRSTDQNVIQAARMDGAGGWRLFFQIELPMVRRTVLVTIFLAIKDALLISAPVIILTEGGPFRSTETLMFYYYVEAFKSGNRAVQNSLSALVLIIAAIAIGILSAGRGVHESVSSRQSNKKHAFFATRKISRAQSPITTSPSSNHEPPLSSSLPAQGKVGAPL